MTQRVIANTPYHRQFGVGYAILWEVNSREGVGFRVFRRFSTRGSGSVAVHHRYDHDAGVATLWGLNKLGVPLFRFLGSVLSLPLNAVLRGRDLSDRPLRQRLSSLNDFHFWQVPFQWGDMRLVAIRCLVTRTNCSLGKRVGYRVCFTIWRFLIGCNAKNLCGTRLCLQGLFIRSK